MIIQDVVNSAKYSELSGVAVKDNIPAIVAFINLGMLEIYKRFPIKVEEHVINLISGTVYYEMPENFMYCIEAFGEQKENSTCSNEISINDEEDLESIFFNDWNTVQVPFSVTGAYVSVIYVAKPTPITVTQAEDGVTTLDIPDTLIDVLLSYVGYRGHMGVKSDSQSENNAHWVRFERSCEKAIELGVAFPSDSSSMSGRITDRGFV